MYIKTRGNPKRMILKRTTQLSNSNVSTNSVTNLTGPSTPELMNREIRVEDNIVKCGKSICGK